MLQSVVTVKNSRNGYPVDEFDPDIISIACGNISVVLLLRQNAAHVPRTRECNLRHRTSTQSYKRTSAYGGGINPRFLVH
jgi:hypothetical protein